MGQSQPSFLSRAAINCARTLIRAYRLLTLGVPRRCRFAPSCSEYMEEALVQKGFIKGLLTGTGRLLRCHPWHPGGFDPVH